MGLAVGGEVVEDDDGCVHLHWTIPRHRSSATHASQQ